MDNFSNSNVTAILYALTGVDYKLHYLWVAGTSNVDTMEENLMGENHEESSLLDTSKVQRGISQIASQKYRLEIF